MTTEERIETAEFQKFYARVMLREYRARRGQKCTEWMLTAAQNARRRAMELRPAQGRLFA